jgi:hypothetical protein
MSPGPSARARLLDLADREFQSLTEGPDQPPPPQRFKALKIRLAKFDAAWPRKRLSLVRLAGMLLIHDDQALAQKVCESDQSARTYAGGVELLRREGEYLRKVARLLDLASGRLSVVLGRGAQKEEAPTVLRNDAAGVQS